MKTLGVLILCAFSFTARAQDSPALKLTRTIPLPGVKGRFDHFAIDAKGHRLFVAALGNNTLEVLDIAAGKMIKSITKLHKPTGVIYNSASNEIGVANGDDGTFQVFEGTAYSLVRKLDSLDDADNVRVDSKTKLTYIGYGAGALAVLDAASMKQIGSIKLPAHPEAFQLETFGNRIYVNVPDAKLVAVIDREKKAVIATWPMTQFKANFPMALDEANHRLFVGCRRPAKVLVFDTSTGKESASLDIVGDTDDLFFDAARKRLYVSGGEGYVDVIQEQDAGRFARIAHVATAAGARTSLYVAEQSRLYLAVPHRGSQKAEIRIYEAR